MSNKNRQPRICPYCGKVRMNGAQHIKWKHPDKPMPSDKGFPGWESVERPGSPMRGRYSYH